MPMVKSFILKPQMAPEQLNVKEFPFVIRDKNGNPIYQETIAGFWWKREYDANGNETRYEDSSGFWRKREYDADRNMTKIEKSYGYWSKREYDVNGKETRYETSEGYWVKREYDATGREIYYENSDGEISDKRPKPVELTLDEIAQKLGIDVNLLKIKK